MTEPLDPLLRALGEVERDYERRHPAAWEAAVAGSADPAAVAAERAAVDPADEHHVFQDMFSRPLSDDQVAAMVERAAAALGRPTEVAPAGAAVAAPSGPAAAPAVAEVVPLRGRGRALALAGAAAALAAALLLWRSTAPVGDLGAYDVTVRNAAVQAMRSSDGAAAVDRYRLDSEIDWVLSPERDVSRVVELRVVARAAGGWEELVTPVYTRSPAGALRIRGRLDAVLPLKPGRWQLAFVVSAAGAAPTSASAVPRAVAEREAIVVPERLEVEVEAAEHAAAP
ncbi:hypothetical protein [Nannocystis pusilla]|uniref:Anti-sigma factor n=1 Tax=Nannocystis pusilla TaxID=889268 RepID=A0ABS7TXC0_9BACT|nr:hypothetical protein [Nannocystis pusilla]MBZ5712898.1 hypothetical protein [Nannocystis pusilla]